MTRVRRDLIRAAIAFVIAASPSVAPAAQDSSSLETRDAAKGQASSGVPRTPVVKVTDDGGFDIGSAGIGAAAMLGLVLAVAGGALVVRPRVRHQSPLRPTTNRS
jgi:hypothetical protein